MRGRMFSSCLLTGAELLRFTSLLSFARPSSPPSPKAVSARSALSTSKRAAMSTWHKPAIPIEFPDVKQARVEEAM
jgi:hypothetical protein